MVPIPGCVDLLHPPHLPRMAYRSLPIPLQCRLCLVTRPSHPFHGKTTPLSFHFLFPLIFSFSSFLLVSFIEMFERIPISVTISLRVCALFFLFGFFLWISVCFLTYTVSVSDWKYVERLLIYFHFCFCLVWSGSLLPLCCYSWFRVLLFPIHSWLYLPFFSLSHVISFIFPFQACLCLKHHLS